MNVQFRPVERVPTHRLVPSHPRNYNFQFLPSRLGPSQFFPRQVVPSRPVSNIVSHEKPCKQVASTDTLGAEIIGLLVACEGQSSMHRHTNTPTSQYTHKCTREVRIIFLMKARCGQTSREFSHRDAHVWLLIKTVVDQ